jgi:hypothetical protein
MKVLRGLGKDVARVHTNLQKFMQRVTMYSWEPYKQGPPPGKKR